MHFLETLCCLHMAAFKYGHSLVQTRDLTVDLSEFVLARLHPLADGVANLALEVTKGLLVVLLQIFNSEHDISVDPLVDGIFKLFEGPVHGLDITVDLAESVLSWLDPLSDGPAQLILLSMASSNCSRVPCMALISPLTSLSLSSVGLTL